MYLFNLSFISRGVALKHLPQSYFIIHLYLTNPSRSSQISATPLKITHVISLFLSFSELDCDPNELSLGDEVEFSLTKKNGKPSSERVVKLPMGTMKQEVRYVYIWLFNLSFFLSLSGELLFFIIYWLIGFFLDFSHTRSKLMSHFVDQSF